MTTDFLKFILMVLLIASLIVNGLFLTAVISTRPPATGGDSQAETPLRHGVQYTWDDVHKVGCWTFFADSISCLPRAEFINHSDSALTMIQD